MNRFRPPDAPPAAARPAARRWRGSRGIAAIEFALAAPLLLTLMLVGADAAVWLQNLNRLDRAASELGNIISQSTALKAADFAGYFAAARQMAAPLVVDGGGGAVIVSGIVSSGGKTTIAWQRRTGATSYASQFGAAGAVPTLPAGYVVPVGQTVIATELASTAHPWILGVVIMGGPGPATLRAHALYRPRSAELSSVN